MLTELRLRNLAVIEEVTVPFGPGLNVLSGETGAGKAIVIDALLPLIGARGPPGVAGGRAGGAPRPARASAAHGAGPSAPAARSLRRVRGAARSPRRAGGALGRDAARAGEPAGGRPGAGTA